MNAPPASATNAPAQAATAPLLELRGIAKQFGASPDWIERLGQRLGWLRPAAAVHALDGVDLAVAQGEVVGLVGESGCGKSTLGRIAVGLHAPTRGTRLWRGTDVDALPEAERRRVQLGIQMIFQDPYASLNPRMRVRDLLAEAPRVHGLISRAEQAGFVAGLLRQVGLDPAMAERFPHQFSGGQRARVGIARALAVKPGFLVCDEAVAALDVSIQAQVLNLFMRLREQLGLTCLFISHDLGVVRHLSDRVAVMYLGRIVENAPVADIFARPAHPYTQGLLAEVPTLKVEKKRFLAIRGELPSPLAPPPGCHFHPRCPHAFDRCRHEAPRLREVAPDHASACHLHD
ncbi:ABC transporter ATP-binding protein [Thauera sinica]|uniref:ABC transporter ATP-binding protein n=1 Tax=Thauera sinica TaxID=2665146 RepID=A0ABW1APN5_9RHOO|nr:ABC transporter ATP-binding protein [Thauera sp. K11]ATE59445.1 peptide ABC transporter ATP-binding protein [Thauera sp. K11]